MPRPVHITTPWPTPEEEAKRLRIPVARQKELRAMAEKYFKQLEADKNGVKGTVIRRSEKPQHASAAD